MHQVSLKSTVILLEIAADLLWSSNPEVSVCFHNRRLNFLCVHLPLMSCRHQIGITRTQSYTWQRGIHREGICLYPLVHYQTWSSSNAHLPISLHSGGLSHLEMAFYAVVTKTAQSLWNTTFVYPSAVLPSFYEFISNKVLSCASSFFQHVTSWDREFFLTQADDLFS